MLSGIFLIAGLPFSRGSQASLPKAVALSGLSMNLTGGLRRCPPRPPDLRQPRYEEEFDFLTALYDCFASSDGRWVVLVGPPLANLESHIVPILRNAFRVG